MSNRELIFAVGCVNRCVQLAAMVGAGIVILILATPAAAVTLDAWTSIDLMKLLALAGLPTMLFFLGGQQRGRIERATARAIAIFTCIFVLLHSSITSSEASPTISTLALLISIQAALMRHYEMKALRD